jgi:hypothetical protein
MIGNAIKLTPPVLRCRVDKRSASTDADLQWCVNAAFIHPTADANSMVLV